jgi:hypothetical protein
MAKASTKPVGFGPRLLIAVFGACLILFGISQIKHGRFLWLNHLRQPVYSTSLLVMGVVLLASVLIPSSWLDRLANWCGDPSRAGAKHVRRQ